MTLVALIIMMCSVSKSFTKETRNAQMTVFYGGQVVVFDDFPAEKVMEILAFASNKGTSYAQNNFGYAFPHDATRFSSDSQRPVSPQSPSAPVVAGNFLYITTLLLFNWMGDLCHCLCKCVFYS